MYCFIVKGHERSQKITYCIAVTENITSQDVVPDGEIHMMIKLDKPHQYYGTETSSRLGKIVTEAIFKKQSQ
jgi:hypothetical protein